MKDDKIKHKNRTQLIKEELSEKEFNSIRELIRMEVASILFDMYRKRRAWINA